MRPYVDGDGEIYVNSSRSEMNIRKGGGGGGRRACCLVEIRCARAVAHFLK